MDQELQIETLQGSRSSLWAVIVGLTICTAPTPAHAQAEGDGLTTRFAINDEDPESSVPTHEQALRAPLEMGYWTMLVAERAEAAVKRGDHQKAVKYWKALGTAVPDRSTAFTRMCATYEAAGDLANAVASCRKALGKGGVTLEDHTRLVRLLLAKQTVLSHAEIGEIEEVITHVERELDKPADPAAGAAPTVGTVQVARIRAQQLRCELGLRLEDEARLEACTNSLASLAPEDPRTIAFAWSLALMRRDFDAAERFVEDAKRLGLPGDAIERMQGKLSMERERASPFVGLLRDGRVWAGAAGVALLGAVAFIALRRRRGLPLAA